MFGAGKDGLIVPPDPNKTFTITMAEVGVFQVGVYHLLMDLTVLYDLTKVNHYDFIIIIILYYFIIIILLLLLVPVAILLLGVLTW